MSLGTKLRALRTGKDLTRDELATVTGVSKSYLWELENRKSQRPSAEKLTAIADALGVTVHYFLEDDRRTPSQWDLDEAFYRDYVKLPPRSKEALRRILKTFKR